MSNSNDNQVSTTQVGIVITLLCLCCKNCHCVFFAFVPGRLRRLGRQIIWDLPDAAPQRYKNNRCPECKSSNVWLWELL
jgi:hypothetical protein